MTTRKYSSRSQQSTLTGAITSGATSMTVVSGTALLGGVTIPTGTTFTLVIDVDTALEEIVDATAVSTNTFTITRAIDGSSAQDHSAGAVVRHMAIGRDYRDANLHAEASAYYNDGSGSGHTMHGIGSGEGDVVGTAKTQTLTNKTLTSPTISDPTITGTASAGAVLVFEGTTADAYETTLTVVDPTQDNTITLPNTTGTVVIVDATQTLTNKTLTSPIIGGSPVITGLSSAGMSDTSATPKNYVDSILGSATAAATSAASAATSASSAATSATSAAASATSAANSASAAATSATSASNSASAASTSASSASTSASSAATSASSAATSASSAATSATSSATSATASATSASASATSATASATSASASATSASAAATSASSAATSASSASTSASSALTSANSAAVSAASAAAAVTTAIQASIIDAKGDLLVGSAADTAARLGVGTDGYVLTAASTATYGIQWAAAAATYTAPTLGTTTLTSGTTVSTIAAVTLDNATLSGTLTAGATSGTNGYLLTSTGTGVEWAAAPVSLPSQTGNDGKALVTNGTTASWSGAVPVAQTTEPSTLIDGLVWVDTDGTAPTTVVTRWQKTGLAAGTTSLSGNDDNSIPLAYTPGYEQVFLNGALLSRANDYTATSGTSITLTTGVVTGDIVEVICATQVAYADTYTQAQSDARFSLNTSAFFAGKNKIINGDFGVWQRGTSFSNPADGAYTADRWAAYGNGSGATKTVSQQTFTPGTAPVAGYEGTYFFRFAQSVAGTGATYNGFRQRIEDVRAFAGQTITVSFWAKADATRTLTIGGIQGFGSGGSADVGIPTFANTLTTSWVRYSGQIAVPSVSGKTIGTNSYLAINFDIAVNTAQTIDIWGVQLEAGSVATAFQTATGTIQGELAACQRYYYRTAPNFAYGYLSGLGVAISTTQANIPIKTPVTMRIAPTSLDYPTVSTLRLTEGVNAYTLGGTPAISGDSSADNVVISGFTVTGITQFRPYYLTANNSTSAYLGFSAEL